MRLLFQSDYFAKELEYKAYLEQLERVGKALEGGQTLYLTTDGELQTAGWARRVLLWLFTSRSRTERVELAIGQLVCYGHEQKFLSHGDICQLVEKVRCKVPRLQPIFSQAVVADPAARCDQLRIFSTTHESRLGPSLFERITFRGPLLPPPKNFGETYLRLTEAALQQQDEKGAQAYFKKYLRFGREREGRMLTITHCSLPLLAKCPALRPLFVQAITEQNARSVMEGLNLYYSTPREKKDQTDVLAGVILDEKNKVRPVLYKALTTLPLLIESLGVIAYRSQDLMQRLEMGNILLERKTQGIEKNLLEWLKKHLTQDEDMNKALGFAQDKPALLKVLGYWARAKDNHLLALSCFRFIGEHAETKVSALKCTEQWTGLDDESGIFVIKCLLEEGEPVRALEGTKHFSNEELLAEVRRECGYYHLRHARDAAASNEERAIAFAAGKDFRADMPNGEQEIAFAEATLKMARKEKEKVNWTDIQPVQLCLESQMLYWELNALHYCSDLNGRLSSWRELAICQPSKLPERVKKDFEQLGSKDPMDVELQLDHLWFGLTELQFTFCKEKAATLLTGAPDLEGDLTFWRDYFYQKENSHWEATYGAWKTSRFGDAKDAYLLAQVAKERYEKKNYKGAIECIEQIDEVPADLIAIRVDAYRQLKCYEEAIRVCVDVPTLHHLYVEYGDALSEQEEYIRASEQYARVAGQHLTQKEKKEFRIHYAEALQILSRRGEAIQLLRDTLRDIGFTSVQKKDIQGVLSEHQEAYRANYTNIHDDPCLSKAEISISRLADIVRDPGSLTRASSPMRGNLASPKISPKKTASPVQPRGTSQEIDAVQNKYVDFPSDYADYGEVRPLLAEKFQACAELMKQPYNALKCQVLAAMTDPSHKPPVVPTVADLKVIIEWLRKTTFLQSPHATRLRHHYASEALKVVKGEERKFFEEQLVTPEQS